METQVRLQIEEFEHYLKASPDSYIVLLKENEDQTTAAGIIIPTEKNRTQIFGTVVSRGRDVEFADIGDKVILSSLSGIDLEDTYINKVKYNLRRIRESDILAIDYR